MDERGRACHTGPYYEIVVHDMCQWYDHAGQSSDGKGYKAETHHESAKIQPWKDGFFSQKPKGRL